MTKERELTSNTITQALTETLKPLNYVHAFYEAGAIAFDRIDEWSDVDLYLVVDDDRVNQAFQDVEKTLQSLSPIKQKYDVPQTGWQESSKHSTDLKRQANTSSSTLPSSQSVAQTSSSNQEYMATPCSTSTNRTKSSFPCSTERPLQKNYRQDWKDCKPDLTCSTTSSRKKSTEGTASKP